MGSVVKQNEKTKNKKRILIVDDHAVVREGLKLLIEQQNDLEVCALAEDSEQAMEYLNQGDYDLVIVDISLNGQSGLKLTEEIKSRKPYLPILVLTMHDEEFYVKRAFRAGAKGYVTKNEAAATVISAIRMMLHGHDYISDSMAQKYLRKIHGNDIDN
ncbi:MAG: response regulator transcription factor [Sedimentisphaerales bacterium]|nr:response regulator transcription factor [Sedimentisphaerales bacterium]